MNTVATGISYEGLLKLFVLGYIREFGERKYKTILDKVMTSNKLSGLISTAKYKSLAPGSKDILYCLNEMPYFIFSRGQTQALAAILTLERWNQEVNSKQYLLTEDGLKLRLINMAASHKVCKR